MMLLLHDASLYLLYAALVLALFLAIERGIFYTHAHRQLQSLLQSLHERRTLPDFRSGDVGAMIVAAFANGLHPSASMSAP